MDTSEIRGDGVRGAQQRNSGYIHLLERSGEHSDHRWRCGSARGMCTRIQLGDRLPEDSPSPEDLQIPSEDSGGGVTRLEASDGRSGGQSDLPFRLAEGAGVLQVQGGGVAPPGGRDPTRTDRPDHGHGFRPAAFATLSAPVQADGQSLLRTEFLFVGALGFWRNGCMGRFSWDCGVVCMCRLQMGLRHGQPAGGRWELHAARSLEVRMASSQWTRPRRHWAANR